MKIMQGDSYPLYFRLKLDGSILTPDMVSEMEICVGECMRKLYTKGEVVYEENAGRWYIWPTQAETLSLTPGPYHVVVRIKFKNANMKEVHGRAIGKLFIADTFSKEVI